MAQPLGTADALDLGAVEYSMGVTALHGLNGETRDIKKVRELFQMAADCGHAAARGELGWMLYVLRALSEIFAALLAICVWGNGRTNLVSTLLLYPLRAFFLSPFQPE